MLYTPPVTPWESVIPEVGSLTFKEGAAQGRTGDWGEVVTRYPYENVGMDHLLSMENEVEKKNRMRTSGLARKRKVLNKEATKINAFT